MHFVFFLKAKARRKALDGFDHREILNVWGITNAFSSHNIQVYENSRWYSINMYNVYGSAIINFLNSWCTYYLPRIHSLYCSTFVMMLHGHQMANMFRIHISFVKNKRTMFLHQNDYTGLAVCIFYQTKHEQRIGLSRDDLGACIKNEVLPPVSLLIPLFQVW